MIQLECLQWFISCVAIVGEGSISLGYIVKVDHSQTGLPMHMFFISMNYNLAKGRSTDVTYI